MVPLLLTQNISLPLITRLLIDNPPWPNFEDVCNYYIDVMLLSNSKSITTEMTSRKLAEGQLSSFGSEETQQDGLP